MVEVRDQSSVDTIAASYPQLSSYIIQRRSIPAGRTALGSLRQYKTGPVASKQVA